MCKKTSSKSLISGKRSEVEFSICIPTYKRTQYLKQAIDSVLMQDDIEKYSYEVIVVNNDPQDEMKELCEQYIDNNNVYFFSNEVNVGMLGNCNQCINLAKGKYVLFLHDDDYLLKNHLKELMKSIEYAKKNNLDADCFIPSRYVLSQSYSYLKKALKNTLSLLFCVRKVYKKYLTKVDYKDALLSWRDCFLAPTCGICFLHDSLQEYGEIKEVFGKAWDFVFLYEFSKKFNVYIMKNRTAVYRLESGVTKNKFTQLDFYEYNQYLLKESELQFNKYFYNEIYWFNYKRNIDETKELIRDKGMFDFNTKYSIIKFLLFKSKQMINYYLRNLDAEKIVSKEDIL